MTTIDQIKQELRDIIEMSEKATPGPWAFDPENIGGGPWPHYGIVNAESGESVPVHVLVEKPANASFITASRNLTPKMARALHGMIEWLEVYCIPTFEAERRLETICREWEAQA